jgi:Mg2+ and Co2+ transporter CorA
MLEKMFRVTDNVHRDIRAIENKVFDQTSSSLVKTIMVKKRNIVVLKHMFKPQIPVLKILEDRINTLFK